MSDVGLSLVQIEVARLAFVAASVVVEPELCSCSSLRARVSLGAPGLDTGVPHAHKKDSAVQPAHDRLSFLGDHHPLVVGVCQDVRLEQERVVGTRVEMSSAA